MVGWFSKWIRQKQRITPADKLIYRIAPEVITFTERVLWEYGTRKPSAEGLVYWAGRQRGNEVFVFVAVAPNTIADRYGIQTSHQSNADFVEFICDNDVQYLCQVHSHPSTWVDHSKVDDEETAFRSEGLVSIVVPSFAAKGMLPLIQCGIHRHQKGCFYRLSNKYIKQKFFVSSLDLPVILKDLRDDTKLVRTKR